MQWVLVTHQAVTVTVTEADVFCAAMQLAVSHTGSQWMSLDCSPQNHTTGY